MLDNFLVVDSLYVVPVRRERQRCDGLPSLPFAVREPGKVAVKIVDDRGIESLKIVSLED